MRAGIDALADFGAVVYRAQAQEELARWLYGRHRDEEAGPLLDDARETYAEIGATGWLTKLESWHRSLGQPAVASSTSGQAPTDRRGQSDPAWRAGRR
jgi:hypothetical protein